MDRWMGGERVVLRGAFREETGGIDRKLWAPVAMKSCALSFR